MTTLFLKSDYLGFFSNHFTKLGIYIILFSKFFIFDIKSQSKIGRLTFYYFTNQEVFSYSFIFQQH